MLLVILAAGMGSRFGGLKQMTPVDNQGHFIIDYSIYDAIEAGFDKVIFVIKKELEEDFINTIGKRFEGKIKIEYAFQELNDLPEGYSLPSERVKPWGTGHAVLAARLQINEPFIMINADDYYGKDTFMEASNFLKAINKDSKYHYANVAFKVGNTLTENGSVKRGVLALKNNGLLESLTESNCEKVNNMVSCTPLDESKKGFMVSPDTLVSMNLFIFTVDFLDLLDREFKLFLNANINNLKAEFLVPDIVDRLNGTSEIDTVVLSSKETWYGITYKEDLEKVKTALKEKVDKGLYKF